ncbi:MAG TPA: PQQ-dependent sugar dehydrogenase [Frankiaceae bacterium]|jgi:glucose/arabinose dehydrogenase|nr:PQQ-dependent sugar dehydrogenase [Frankiaceae bacterium]
MSARFAASPRRFVSSTITLVLIAAAVLVALVQTAQTAHAALPTGFSDNVVLSGLVNPTQLDFAPDGSILVGEKSGKILSFKSFSDTSPTLVADLSSEVDDYWDRGLLGLAVPPNYPTDNHLYVLYARDAPPGGTTPTWNDLCPTPPGPTTDGCTVSGRLSQLTLDNGVKSSEQPLVDGWCQQFPSHSIGELAFGSDGYLYASGGEGANFNAVDYGQFGAASSGDKANPCGDPPGTVGTALTPPTAEGGSLRSQSVRRTDGPAVLNGAIIRVDPTTGAAAPGNPFAGDADANKARILDYGLRNPFRFTTRPNTNELWVGDVGAGSWEEINKVPDTTAGTALNFGWPCYEGVGQNGGFSSAGLNMCKTLYTAGSATSPYFAYDHSKTLSTTDGCPTGGSSISGIAFYGGTSYPSSMQGALFFADHTRQCMWAMLPDAGGNPDPTKILSLGHVANPVQIVAGTAAYNNDLFYVDMDAGAIHRLSYTTGSVPPTAVAKVTPASGPAPLTVSFNSAGSSDPQGLALSYSWNFGDGTTSTSASGTHTYTAAGSYTAKLTVMDTQGLTGSASVPVLVGSAKITNLKATVTSPTGTVRTKYRVADHLNFSATAVDASNAQIPASNFSWHLSIHHCITTTNCHTHDGGTIAGVKSGFYPAPDHEFPSYMTIELTVTLPGSANTLGGVLTIQPQTVNVKFTTNQAQSLHLAVDGVSKYTPFTVAMVMGHLASISAPSPEYLYGHKFTYTSWSDKGAETHTIVAPTAAATRTANYKKVY